MKKKMYCSVVMLAFCASIWSLTPWKKGAFETKEYRNVFVEMGYDARTVNIRLQQIFSEVFYGPNRFISRWAIRWVIYLTLKTTMCEQKV